MRRSGLAGLRCGSPGQRATLLVSFFTTVLVVSPGAASAQSLPAFNWMRAVDNSGLAYTLFAGLAMDGQGNVYVAGSTRSPNFPVVSAVQNHLATTGSYDVFVTKYDPSGNVVYSTYFGGSADDIARAMTVDAAGNVYVAGTTTSQDFPTTSGSWSPNMPAPPPPISAWNNYFEGAIFVFRLNPDGAVGYSTYFTSQSAPTDPQAMAVDAAGAVYLTGITYGGMPTTPDAYQTVCSCGQVGGGPGSIGPPEFNSDAFLTKFDATGSKLVFSTYLGVQNAAGGSVAVGPDGSVYVGSTTGIYRLDETGSSLLGSTGKSITGGPMTIASDGRVYIAGLNGLSVLVMDAQLQNTLAAVWFGQNPAPKAIMLDGSGNVYLGGATSVGLLPTHTPLQEGFGGSLATGFVSEISSDLSTLLFSSQFGDGSYFYVSGIGVGPNGAIALGGPTDKGTVWANSVQPAALPPLRIDAVTNAASLLDNPISAGEAIVVHGGGFGSDAQLLLGGEAVPAISAAPNAIAVVVPSDLGSGPVMAQVQSGGSATNQVLLNMTSTSPGIFSADGSGAGQAYIVNQDGTMNSASHPAATGDEITIYATGIGPVSFNNGYAVSQFPADVYIDGFHCDGLAAVMGPVAGLPGQVYQLTVRVPDPASMAASNPSLAGFKFRPQEAIVLNAGDRQTQGGLYISLAQ
jgi:uncharacterized protein (TIGR03437 family)